jgi:hypothetical protein
MSGFFRSGQFLVLRFHFSSSCPCIKRELEKYRNLGYDNDKDWQDMIGPLQMIYMAATEDLITNKVHYLAPRESLVTTGHCHLTPIQVLVITGSHCMIFNRVWLTLKVITWSPLRVTDWPPLRIWLSLRVFISPHAGLSPGSQWESGSHLRVLIWLPSLETIILVSVTTVFKQSMPNVFGVSVTCASGCLLWVLSDLRMLHAGTWKKVSLITSPRVNSGWGLSQGC